MNVFTPDHKANNPYAFFDAQVEHLKKITDRIISIRETAEMNEAEVALLRDEDLMQEGKE